jgi:hypothetical protein
MSEINIFVICFDYAAAFIEKLPNNFPNFKYSCNQLYVTGEILKILSSKGYDFLEDDNFDEILVNTLDKNISDLKNNLYDSYLDFISELSDDLIDILSGLPDDVQKNIIMSSISDLIINSADIYDNSDINILSARIQPYVITNLKTLNNLDQSD